MCGIVGHVRKPGGEARLSEERKTQILSSIHHRGPDSQGQYTDNCVWLGHARLSILDLSPAGNQPMETDDGRFVICYNGEVYNFADLMQAWELRNLRSHSDTEVVLRGFEKLGPEAVRQMNGMFAFAIYDRQAQKVWLVRDRLGIKPLYYLINEQGLAFASEMKALLAIQGGAPRCETASLHEWNYYGTTLGERTLYRGIYKLLPGHYLELDIARFESKIVRYWSPVEYAGIEKNPAPEEARIQQVRDLLEQAVKRQLVSDVPVGVFLSGGVDSSAITAFASQHYPGRLATYSVCFDYSKGVNELPRARVVATRFGTDHHELHVAGKDVADVVVKMIDHHDTPFSDAANIPLYQICDQIRDTTKVVLQGDGGDELFGGYSRYMTLSHYRLARFLAGIGRVANALTPRNISHYRRLRYFNALGAGDLASVMAALLTEEDVRTSPSRVFAPEFRKQVTLTDPFAYYRQCQAHFTQEDVANQMLLVDSMIILPDVFLEKVDRSTMAASVEVRVPFLDNDLVDYGMRLSGPQKVRFGRKKWLLKKALEGLVPHEILYGRKTGFSVPSGFWLRGALRPLFEDQLTTFLNQHPGILDGATIRSLYGEHLAERRNYSFLLWKIMNFMIWANRYRVSFQ
jgi:asparagine synthase (glutamine-hydrolysing)